MTTQYRTAQELFEVEYNCECQPKLTELEALLCDVPAGTYKDIDIRIMYKEFFVKGKYMRRNHTNKTNEVYVWDLSGEIDQRRSMSATFKSNFTG